MRRAKPTDARSVEEFVAIGGVITRCPAAGTQELRRAVRRRGTSDPFHTGKPKPPPWGRQAW